MNLYEQSTIGDDTGASLRYSAHYCGICARKPTFGYIPTTGNFPVDGFGLASQLVSIGSMARKVVDLRELKVAYFYENPCGTSPTAETIKAVDLAVDTLKPYVKDVNEIYPSILNEVYRLHKEEQ